MQTAPADLLVGRLLEGRYRILDRIARGGMSTVYAAVDERLDRLVAVKVMSSALSSDPKFGDRFAREARAAAKLTHVNAVAVYDQGHDISDGGHHVFLVMELVEGRTLRDLIRERNGRFTAAEAISILEPVLAALAAAHRAGLVHRDVKPENILLSDGGIVKVADFGLARAVDSDASSTRTGLMMGTVAYCSPEQISRGYADPRSDVYSAGIVLFELLTGRPPYQGESAMNVAYQHVHSRVPAPSSRVKGVPNEIDELVVAATDSDPSARPPDGGSFLAEIADVRTALGLPVAPIPARPRGTGSPTIDPRDSRARASTDVLGGDARSATGHDTQLVQPRPPANIDAPPPPIVIPPPKQGSPPSPRARRRRRRWIALAIVLLVGALSVFAGIAASRWYQRWNSHVPSLVGHSLSDATNRLHSEHYAIGQVVKQFSDTVPRNEVISTDPGSGARLEQGHPIDLVVSLGQDLVQVPFVYKQPLDTALAMFAARGVKVSSSPRYVSSWTVPKGDVISVDPSAGKAIQRNVVVRLTVSNGKPTRTVPSIPQGMSFDAAKQALTDAHFHVVEQIEYNEDGIAPGDVISSAPDGVQIVGTTITVNVSKGSAYVTMPTLGFGMGYADAKAQLEQLGLVVTKKAPLGEGKHDRVVDQDPLPGVRVRIGSTVTLTVV